MDQKIGASTMKMKELVTLLKRCLKQVREDSLEGIAAKSLINGRSFQLTVDASSDRLIGFRELRRAMIRLRPKSLGFKNYSNENIAVAVGYMHSADAVKAYIEYSSTDKIGSILARFDISAQVQVSLKDRLSLVIFGIPIAFSCLWSSNRANKALLIRALAINFNLVNILLQNRIKKFYNFVPFEIDSNFQSLLLRSIGINVVFIPSSGPLSTWNRLMIADAVIFSTPYHYEEYEVNKATMRVNEILRWGPEKAYGYFYRYTLNRKSGEKNRIGFYSHGSWLRLALGHVQTEMNLMQAEDNCIERLKDFLNKNTEYELVIFAHPREKTEKNLAHSIEHYNRTFHGVKWSFADFSKSSAEQFDLVDVGIATFSTIIYERLFCGYKTLLCTEGISGFPMAGSTLTNICFQNSNSLDNKLKEAMRVSECEFFEMHNIKGYKSDLIVWE